MFQELMPLLSQRVLILTLSRVSDEEVCVNVVPKPLKSSQQNGVMWPYTKGRPAALNEVFSGHRPVTRRYPAWLVRAKPARDGHLASDFSAGPADCSGIE